MDLKKIEPTPIDATISSQSGNCANCGRTSEKLKKCGACKLSEYCSKRCQRKHWKQHKKKCATQLKSDDGKREKPKRHLQSSQPEKDPGVQRAYVQTFNNIPLAHVTFGRDGNNPTSVLYATRTIPAHDGGEYSSKDCILYEHGLPIMTNDKNPDTGFLGLRLNSILILKDGTQIPFLKFVQTVSAIVNSEAVPLSSNMKFAVEVVMGLCPHGNLPEDEILSIIDTYKSLFLYGSGSTLTEKEKETLYLILWKLSKNSFTRALTTDEVDVCRKIHDIAATAMIFIAPVTTAASHSNNPTAGYCISMNKKTGAMGMHLFPVEGAKAGDPFTITYCNNPEMLRYKYGILPGYEQKKAPPGIMELAEKSSRLGEPAEGLVPIFPIFA
jgi:hypothetical protein